MRLWLRSTLALCCVSNSPTHVLKCTRSCGPAPAATFRFVGPTCARIAVGLRSINCVCNSMSACRVDARCAVESCVLEVSVAQAHSELGLRVFGLSAMRRCISICVGVFFGASALQTQPRPRIESVNTAELEAVLAKQCGAPCLSVWQRAFDNATSEPGANRGGIALSWLSDEVERTLAHAGRWAASAEATAGKSRSEAASGGVACSTPAACAMRSIAANKCNYARVAMQNTYNELNVATHVLGTAISSLCGCVRVGHVSSCLLRSIPAVCTFPYEVYAKAFAASTQAWEAVKATTANCVVHA